MRILKSAARAGGAVLNEYFQKEFVISLKTSIHDTVTEVDHKAQKEIVLAIEEGAKKTPLEGKVGYLGEEDLYQPGQYLFVIDPLDGTSNFAAGMAYFCVSIAVFKDKKLVAGVVYDVREDLLYSAYKGLGAYANDRKIQIPSGKTLKEAYVISSISKRESERRGRLIHIGKIFSQLRCVRVFGSLALDISRVSAGHGDIAWGGGAIWDIAAADAIMTEAGGEVVDHQQRPFSYDLMDSKKYYSFIAGNKKLIKEFCSKLFLDGIYEGREEGKEEGGAA